MANKTLTVIVAAVVVIAAVAVAAVVLLNNSDGEDSNFTVEGIELMIYGNANNDLTIDEEDMELVLNIIEEELDWEIEYPLADVNCDGVVDESDVTLLQQIINREECTLYVACLDTNRNSTYVSVSYPLENITLVGVNVIMAALYGNIGNSVAAWSSPPTEYSNAYATLSGTNIMSSSVYMDVDAFTRVDSATPIGAVFIDANYSWSVPDSGYSSFEASGIPYLIYAAMGPEDQASAALTIGFLCGSETEESSYQFVQDSLEVLEYINEVLGDISDEDKTVFMLMGSSATTIAQNSHPYQNIGILAGGTPYYQTNSEFASSYEGTSTGTTALDAIAEYRDADAYITVLSKDFGSTAYEMAVTLLEPTSGNDPFTFYYDVIDKWYYINNLLPGVVKVAYAAEILYPELFEGYGDQVLQQFIDAGYSPLQGQTIESIVPFLTYQDYLDAKAAGY